MNPCKCGGVIARASCRRGPRCADDYQARVSGPLLDRIDLQIEVPAVSAADLVLPPPRKAAPTCAPVSPPRASGSAQRFLALGVKSVRTNAECSGQLLEQTAMPDDAGLALLRQAAETLALSARGFHRTLKVARTLADLDGLDKVGRIHIAEALSYRAETLRQSRQPEH